MNQFINFTIGAAIGATFGASLGKAQSQLGSLDLKLKKLSEQKIEFKALEQAEQKVSTLRDKVQQSSESVQVLKLRLKNATDPKDQQAIQALLDKQLNTRNKLSNELAKGVELDCNIPG